MCEANALEERWKAGEDVEEQGRALAHDVDFMWDALEKKYEDQEEEWFETYKSAQAKSYAENGCPPNHWDLPWIMNSGSLSRFFYELPSGLWIETS